MAWKPWPPSKSAMESVCWVAVYNEWDKKVRVGMYYVGQFWGDKPWLFYEDEGQWKAEGSTTVENVRGWQKMVPPEWDG